MNVEAVLLSGGASRRMGEDKAKIQIDGQAMAERLVSSLTAIGISVTVIGREPVEGAEFIKDEEDFAGPLVALARFSPTREFVFAVSCDLPLFDANVVSALASEIQNKQAAIPKIAGRLQPLCALYRAGAIAVAADVLNEGKKSLMAWVKRLDVEELEEQRLADAGIDPASVLGVNTPSELIEALRTKAATLALHDSES